MKNIIKFLIGFLLFLVAYILFIPIMIIDFICMIFRGFNFTNYFKDRALALDIYGNMNFNNLFDFLLRKSSGYKFGREGETISSALGKNQMLGKLSILGKLLVWILHVIEKNHCIISVQNFEVTIEDSKLEVLWWEYKLKLDIN